MRASFLGTALAIAAVTTTGCGVDIARVLELPSRDRAHVAALPSDPDLIALCAPRAGAPDEDDDSLPDDCEQEIAERFAPVIYHSTDETNFPTNVDRFLERTRLAYYDTACGDLGVPIFVRPKQEELLGRRRRSCAGGQLVRSDGTRSERKRRTFYLEDVDVEGRAGSSDPREWTTYVHAYRNDRKGVTVQYWRFYAYNDAVNDHGGDWEGVHVVLDEAMRPVAVRFLQHGGIHELPFDAVGREGTHARMFSEGGGHATWPTGDGIKSRGCGHVDCTIDPSDPRTYVRQETWTGGVVRFSWRASMRGGAIMNIGEKLRPMHGQHFVAYSGLWGSPGQIFGTSGYWGPAFNETSMREDGYVSAWCAGMIGDRVRTECYARDAAP